MGGHVLAGTALAIGVSLLGALGPQSPGDVSLPVDASGSIAWLANVMVTGIAAALLLTLLWLLFRIPARRNWLASVLFVVFGVLGRGATTLRWTDILFLIVLAALSALIIVRFGVLATVAFFFTWYCANAGSAPWTTSFSVWYAKTTLLAIAAILAVTIYGFRTTLAGRPLWRDEMQRTSPV